VGVPSDRQRRRMGNVAAAAGVSLGIATPTVWPGANLASGSGRAGAGAGPSSGSHPVPGQVESPASGSARSPRMPLRLMIQYLEAKWHVHGPDAEPAMDPGSEYAERLVTQCGEAIERSEPMRDGHTTLGAVWLPAQRMELEFVANRAPAKFRDQFEDLLASLGRLEQRQLELQRLAGCAEWAVEEVAAEMGAYGIPAFVAEAFVGERIDGACLLEMSELEVLQIVQHAKRASDGVRGAGSIGQRDHVPSAGSLTWDFVRTCQLERKRARREALYASKLSELGENLQQQYASKHAEDPW